MTIKDIIYKALDLLPIILITIVLFIIVKKLIALGKDYLETKNKQIEQDKVKLYCNVNPTLVKQELQLFITEYVTRYMTKNVMVNQINFIKNDQIDEMVKSVVKDVVMEMSDLYLDYCKLLYTINDEDDLLKVVYYLTVDIVLDAVTRFNGDNNE